MAVGFGGTTRYNASFSAITNYPISLFIQARHNSTATEGYPLQYSQQPGNSDVNQTLGFRGDSVGDPIQYRRGNNASSTTSTVNSSSGYAANTWTSLGAVSISANASDASVFLDGVKTSTATAGTFFGSQSSPIILLGAFVSVNAYSAFLNGGAFKAALWNVTLSDAEMVSLSKGFSPRRVRPQSLRLYMPLVRSVQELIAALSITATNAAAAVDSPRAYGF